MGPYALDEPQVGEASALIELLRAAAFCDMDAIANFKPTSVSPSKKLLTVVPSFFF